MAYKRLFIDSDVLLDLLLNRHPFFYYVQALLTESEKQNLEICTSSLAIANINYILTKEIGAAEAKRKVNELIRYIKILSFDVESIKLAIHSRFSDLEDAFQHFIAKQYYCDVIITRNVKDYKHAETAVFTAEGLLRQLL